MQECNDKYAGIIAAKGLATPEVVEQTAIPKPRITAEQQLEAETAEYLENNKPPAQRPDSDLDEDAELDDGEPDDFA